MKNKGIVMNEVYFKNISLKDQKGSNNLNAYELNDGVSIEVFEFECELSKEDAVKLRDFLSEILEENILDG